MADAEDFVCCSGCRAIDGLWPRIQRARSLLHHRPPNADTVARVLRVLDGDPPEGLMPESPTGKGGS